MGAEMQADDRIGSRITFRDLHVLLTVVRERSMNRAAAVLNTTQPSVSRSIGALEATVGVRLLDRTPQGVEPTAFGRVLLAGGIAAFDDLRQALKGIEFLADPAAGQVRIGCNLWLAPGFVAAIVDRMSRRFPRVEFHIAVPPPEMLQREFLDRKIDLLIGATLGSLDEQLNFELLYEESHVVAASTANPYARRRRIQLAELMNELWTLPTPQSAFGAIIREGFRSVGLDYPRTTLFTHVPEMRISLLTTGRYITLFPASMVRFPGKHAEIKLLPVRIPMARVPVGVVTLKNRSLSPVAALFVETAREVAKSVALARDR
jgi:DNA-binding transcriptional LysR family regulator